MVVAVGMHDAQQIRMRSLDHACKKNSSVHKQCQNVTDIFSLLFVCDVKEGWCLLLSNSQYNPVSFGIKKTVYRSSKKPEIIHARNRIDGCRISLLLLYFFSLPI